MATRLYEGKDKTLALQSLFGTPSSPIPSLKMMTFNPSTTRSRGKAKVGKSVWDDPATTLGIAHNVVIDDELKGLSSIPSHKLVSCHIHKLVQVLGEYLHLTTNYLSSEEKVVVANSKVDFVEAKRSRLRKDLIEAIDRPSKAKEKVKELKAALKFEQYFKCFKLLHWWMMKHHSHVADFANMDFEAIDTEILVDEANEKEGETIAEANEVVEGEGATIGGANDET
nr:hypothetical protein CFP56_10933 [Quercus suber]